MTRGSTAHAEIADPPPRPPPAQKMWMRSPMGKAWRTHSSVMLHLHSHIAFLFPSSEHHRVKKKIASWWSLKKSLKDSGGVAMGNGLPPANNHPESAADIRLMDSNGASDPSRECVKKLRSFYSIETETLSLLSPLKGSFPSSSLPPLPFSLLLSLPSCRFIFSGRVLDINCPASIVTGKHTVQLAQIPLLTTIRSRTTEPQVPAPLLPSPLVSIWFKSPALSWVKSCWNRMGPKEPLVVVILSGALHFPRNGKVARKHAGKSNELKAKSNKAKWDRVGSQEFLSCCQGFSKRRQATVCVQERDVWLNTSLPCRLKRVHKKVDPGSCFHPRWINAPNISSKCFQFKGMGRWKRCLLNQYSLPRTLPLKSTVVMQCHQVSRGRWAI